MYFLRNVPTRAMEDLKHCNLNCLLNISNHYAILPYKCILNKTGLSINTREVRNNAQLFLIFLSISFLNNIDVSNRVELLFNI